MEVGKLKGTVHRKWKSYGDDQGCKVFVGSRERSGENNRKKEKEERRECKKKNKDRKKFI